MSYFLNEFFEFLYRDVKELPLGPVICMGKAVGLTVLCSLASVVCVYLLLTSAFLFCCITYIPIYLIDKYWEEFWGDLAFTYIWMWIVGLTISAIISGIVFLPVWLCIPLALVVLVVVIAGIAIACSVVIAGSVAAIPPLLIIGILYLLYISCPYCCTFFGSCCKKSGECLGECCEESGECLGDCCKKSSECLGECCEESCDLLGDCCKNSFEITSECCSMCSDCSKSVCIYCGKRINNMSMFCGSCCIIMCSSCNNSIKKRSTKPNPPIDIDDNVIEITIDEDRTKTVLPPINENTVIFESTYDIEMH